MATKASKATKAHLRRLVDRLPDSETESARRYLEYLLTTADPVLRAFLLAPEDDEPVTPDDLAAIKEGLKDLKAGRVYSREQMRQELH